jgi:Cu/Ag efflux pump CusA
LGVLPLAVSTGAGAASRHSIGTGVIGGMLAATFIAVLFIPLFFVVTSRMGAIARDWWRERFAHRRHPPSAPAAKG